MRWARDVIGPVEFDSVGDDQAEYFGLHYFVADWLVRDRDTGEAFSAGETLEVGEFGRLVDEGPMTECDAMSLAADLNASNCDRCVEFRVRADPERAARILNDNARICERA